MEFPPTRAAGLARLDEFLPRAAKYARSRNFDPGPDDRSHVSCLSPYLRTRLVTEEEVARAVLGRFAPSTVDKFLQEIAWRSYWKGWLEMRPQVWGRYRSALAALPRDAGHEAAVAGRTGIRCFDAWAGELRRHGYLHNHARMWFASIWIFTLRLPWQLGAEFFLRHLLDGDPASNTLSWRWVAGLHTRGKHYLARASNIAKYTGGRFDPAGRLNESAAALAPDELPDPRPLELPPPLDGHGRLGHLLLPDDLAPPPVGVAATGGWMPDTPRDALGVADRVAGFLSGALDDALGRAGGRRLRGDPGPALREWVERERLDAIVLARPTVGPWRDALGGVDPGVPLRPFVRDWDRRLWPHAGAGFFKLRKRLPALFGELSGNRT